MDLHYPIGAIPSLVALAGLLVIFAITGVKRGWTGQIAMLGVTIALWGAFNARADALVRFANSAYRGVLFLASCGTADDPFACLETSGITQRVILDPQDPDQQRLFYLAMLVFALLVTYVLIMRFGREPDSTLHRLVGAATGVLNAFILGYLLLPLAAQQVPISLRSASIGQTEGPSQIAGPATGSANVWGEGVSVVFLVLFVLFVLVAVRFIRPTSPDR
jgi:hypothetical protein